MEEYALYLLPHVLKYSPFYSKPVIIALLYNRTKEETMFDYTKKFQESKSIIDRSPEMTHQKLRRPASE